MAEDEVDNYVNSTDCVVRDGVLTPTGKRRRRGEKIYTVLVMCSISISSLRVFPVADRSRLPLAAETRNCRASFLPGLLVRSQLAASIFVFSLIINVCW